MANSTTSKIQKVKGLKKKSKKHLQILQDVVQKNAIGEVRESQLSWSLGECAEL